MSFPSPADVAAGRAALADTFVDTAEVSRAGSAVDSEGNPTDVLTAVGTLPGRAVTPTADELAVAAQAGQRLAAIFKTAVDADVEEADIVNLNSQQWRVVAVNRRRFSTHLHLAAIDE